MIDKLNAVERHYEELLRQMSDPAVQADQTKYRTHASRWPRSNRWWRDSGLQGRRDADRGAEGLLATGDAISGNWPRTSSAS